MKQIPQTDVFCKIGILIYDFRFVALDMPLQVIPAMRM